MEARENIVALAGADEGRLSVTNAAAGQTRQALQDIAFGSTAGIIGKFVEYPFDTVKVRLQSQPQDKPLQYTGPLDCFRQSWRREGIRGLYRGISAPIFGAAIETSSLFFSYRVAQDVLQSSYYNHIDTLPLPALVFCGAVSGAATSLLLTPIELIKCRMQVPQKSPSGTPRTLGPLQLIATVFRQQGILGFWHGQLGTLIRETGGSAAWFGSFEGMSLMFRRLRSKDIDFKTPLPLHQQMLSGAVAGMAYNFMFYPADTIKSRMQTEDLSVARPGTRNTFWSVGKALWRDQGLKGLYRGCGITVGRAAPSSALIFTVYEALKQAFE